ncbi:hypothetical protein KJ865_01110, partial [Myxococcota bacterium]|nr:hypothetical protein [Myxococcota bacterium]
MTWANLHSFAHPRGFGFWAVTFVVLSIFGFVLGAALRKRKWHSLGDEAIIDRLIGSRSAFLMVLRPVLLTVALVLILLAFAKPQTEGRTITMQSQGLDMVVALDFSKSMNVKDMHGTRLEHAKREMNKLISSGGGDR